MTKVRKALKKLIARDVWELRRVHRRIAGDHWRWTMQGRGAVPWVYAARHLEHKWIAPFPGWNQPTKIGLRIFFPNGVPGGAYFTRSTRAIFSQS